MRSAGQPDLGLTHMGRMTALGDGPVHTWMSTPSVRRCSPEPCSAGHFGVSRKKHCRRLLCVHLFSSHLFILGPRENSLNLHHAREQSFWHSIVTTCVHFTQKPRGTKERPAGSVRDTASDMATCCLRPVAHSTDHILPEASSPHCHQAHHAS
jgi:hypothetical protein